MGQYAANFRFTVTDLGNGFDVILGMPWLEALQPLITWKTKTLTLNWRGQEPAVEGQKIQRTGAAATAWAAPILIQQVSEHCIRRDACQEGAEAVLFVIREKSQVVQVQEEDPELLALKKEYSDVLVTELPLGLPPPQEVDHAIELLPGNHRIPNRPTYRMSP